MSFSFRSSPACEGPCLAPQLLSRLRRTGKGACRCEFRVAYTVSFRQCCEACECKTVSAAGISLGAGVFCKQVFHIIADAISKIVADDAHAVQLGD